MGVEVGNTPLTLRPDLVANAASEGIWMAVVGLLMVPGGLLLTVLGGVFPCLLIIGPLCILAGLVAMPLGVWQFFSPTSSSEISKLGASADERRAKAREIEDVMMRPESLHGRFSSQRTLTIAGDWLVLHGGALFIARRADILHAWPSVTVRKRYGIETGREHKLHVRIRGSTAKEFDIQADESPGLLGILTLANPAAIIGYDALTESLAEDALVAKVAARATGAPPPPGPTAPPMSGASGAAFSPVNPEPVVSLPGSAPAASPPPRPTSTPLPPRPPAKPMSMWPFAAIGGAVFLLVFGSFGAMFLGCGGLLGLGIWVDSHLEPLRDVCRTGTPVPGASADPIDSDSIVIAFEHKGDLLLTSNTDLPKSLHTGMTDAEVVVCMEQEKQETIEVCADGRERRQYGQHIRVFQAATAALLVEDDALGSTPADCASRAGLTGLSVTSADRGAVVSRALGIPVP